MSTTPNARGTQSTQPAGNRPENPLAKTGLSQDDLCPARDLYEYAKVYAREKPETLALWCFGVGFILGWKLKPW